MKKILCMVLALMVALSLVACTMNTDISWYKKTHPMW